MKPQPEPVSSQTLYGQPSINPPAGPYQQAFMAPPAFNYPGSYNQFNTYNSFGPSYYVPGHQPQPQPFPTPHTYAPPSTPFNPYAAVQAGGSQVGLGPVTFEEKKEDKK